MIAGERAAVERVSALVERNGLSWHRSDASYALVRLPAGPGIAARRALAAIDSPSTRHPFVEPSTVIEVPEELDAELAVLLPFVTEALRAWDLLDLEIGSAAITTAGSPWSGLVAAAARCYGAVPMSAGGGRSAGAAIADADAVAGFAATLRAYPAVCAVELSGRADVIDLVLEAVPREARVLIAGPAGDRLTIDYYVNVHRKGMHLKSTVLSPGRLLRGEESDRQRASRACRLLGNPQRSAAFLQAFQDASRDADR